MSAAVLAAVLLVSPLPVVAHADREAGPRYWDTVEQCRRETIEERFRSE